MTVNNYIVGEDGRVLKFTKTDKPGNPYRDHITSKFASRKKKMLKTMKMYFIDQEDNKMYTKEEYDKIITKMIFENKEVQE